MSPPDAGGRRPGSVVATAVAAALRDASRQPYWLDRSDVAAPALRPPLTGRHAADLLVVGAGLTGLWAAYEAARAGLRVVVVDSGAIGSGASGRCGGFINSSITHGIANGHSHWPDEMASILAIQRAVWDDTVRLVGDGGSTSAMAPIIEPGGKLTVATRPHHLAHCGIAVELLRRYGEDVELLDADALGVHVTSPTYHGGYSLKSGNGLCDPARLAWRLAELAEAHGVTIVEHAPVRRLRREGAGVAGELVDGAVVVAAQALLCTNAYPPLLRRLTARVIPVYDHVIATGPLDAATWDAIGWRTRVGITDVGNQFHYYRPTPEGGVLFGGWEATYHFGGRVDARHEHDPGVHALLVEHLWQTFPALEGVAVTNAWGGPIDSTSRFTPTMHTAWGNRVGWAVGFTGLGVGASRFAALAALDLLARRPTERTALSMVRRQPLPFPPEPLRWPVVALTKRALQHEDATGRRGPWLRLLDRLGVGFDT